MSAPSYEELCASHRWDVPERYNIAADVCDKHPRDKPAMVWESFDGSTRELDWGELQDLANQAAHTLAARGVARGDRVAVVLPPTPEAAAIFFGVWKLGAILLSMSVLYGDDGIQHRLSDSEARLLVTDAENAPRFDRPWAPETLVLDEDTLAGAPTDHVCEDTSADDPAQLYYTSGTTGMAKGIVHAHRYILAHEEFRYCHEVADGERFHGMGEWAWAAGIAPLLGPWRLGAVQCVYRREGGFDPHRQLDFLSRHKVTNVFTTPTAMRAMMAIPDAGTRYPQVFRRVCSAGEPLNPEAIRWFRDQYGVTVLDYYGLTESYPLVANYPVLEVREGSMGRPMPGWDVQILDEDEQPVTRGERGEICLRARSNPHYPLGYWRNEEAGAGVLRRRVVPLGRRRRPGRGRVLLVRRPSGRRDHRRRLPHRPVRGRVRVPGACRRARGRSGRVTRTSCAATWSRRSSCWRTATSRRMSSPRRSRLSCATGCPRTRIRGESSSCPTCRRP